MVGQMVLRPACSLTSVKVPSPLLWKSRLGVLRSKSPPSADAMALRAQVLPEIDPPPPGPIWRSI